MAEKYTAEELRMAEIARKELEKMDAAKKEAVKKSDNKLLGFLKELLQAAPVILSAVAAIITAIKGGGGDS